MCIKLKVSTPSTTEPNRWNVEDRNTLNNQPCLTRFQTGYGDLLISKAADSAQPCHPPCHPPAPPWAPPCALLVVPEDLEANAWRHPVLLQGPCWSSAQQSVVLAAAPNGAGAEKEMAGKWLQFWEED